MLRWFDDGCLNAFVQQYEKEGKWVYEQHPFWCTGYTYWELHSEAPDLFLHLSRSDLVFFKGDLNHRKLTYDCAAPASTPFDVAIGSMASAAGAPKMCSLRTIKSDVVVGLGDDGDRIAEKLDKEEPGWKISGKYVRDVSKCLFDHMLIDTLARLLCYYPKAVREKRSALRETLFRLELACEDSQSPGSWSFVGHVSCTHLSATSPLYFLFPFSLLCMSPM